MNCKLSNQYSSQIKQYQQIQQMIDWIKKATGNNTNSNPRFHVKTQPQYVDISSTLTLTAFTDSTETALLPCHYKWYKIRNGLKQEANKFKGSSYVCDSSDLGAIIQADVISNDLEYSGQVTVQFGPIKLTGELKKSIMETLINGSYTIKACVINGEFQQKQCQFKIFEDMIKIIHQPSQLNFSFNYTTYEPRIEGFSKDSTKIFVNFLQNQGNANLFLRNLFGPQYDQSSRSNNGETIMQVKFASKQQKQWFLLTLKAFFTKKNLKNSVLIRKIEQSSFKQNQDIDLLMEIDSLRFDLLKALSMSEQKEREKVILGEQVRRLQKQIEQIISTYQKIIDNRVKNAKQFNDSYAYFNNKKDDFFGRKCENLQKENGNLNQRIRMLTAEIDQIRFNTSVVKKNQTLYGPNPNIPNMTHITSIRMNQPHPRQTTTFQNILQQLSESRVTQYNQQSIRLGQQIDRVNEEKAQLQKKLQKSFRTIDELEKKINNPQTHAHTVINFNKQDINTSNYSLTVDLDRAKQQNCKLKMMNESLKVENRNLQNQIKNVSSSSRIIIKPSNVRSGQNSRILINQEREKEMDRQMQSLKKELAELRQKLNSEEIKNEKLLREKILLQRKVTDLGRELQMYKKNQQVLNRSQYLSMEMETYNEEKMKVLKDQNDFLLNQNEKLTKACEKYMNQARENIQLRKEILQLKQKAGTKFLNPQKQTNSILLSPLNRSEYSDIISRKM